MTVEAINTCCEGHICDNCYRCKHGFCCRKDMPDYHPPSFGDWTEPVFGEMAVLAADGDEVECHVCGKHYRSLPIHVFRTHGIWPYEYKILFGLNLGTALVGKSTSAKHSATARAMIATGRLIPGGPERLPTAEQLSFIASRKRTPQGLRNAKAAAIKRGENPEFGAKISRTMRAKRPTLICERCGNSFVRENPKRSKRYCTRKCGLRIGNKA